MSSRISVGEFIRDNVDLAVDEVPVYELAEMYVCEIGEFCDDDLSEDIAELRDRIQSLAHEARVLSEPHIVNDAVAEQNALQRELAVLMHARKQIANEWF